jgi:hypothetical protein
MNPGDRIEVIDLTKYRAKSKDRWRECEESAAILEAWELSRERLEARRREDRYHARWNLAILALVTAAAVLMGIGWLR